MEEEEKKDKEEPKVRYGWDENKRQSNLEKHPGYDFVDAHKLWESGAPVKEDYSERKGEERWKATGRIDADTTVVVYEEKREDLHWIISFREADQREREEYEHWIGRETGREDNVTKLIEKIQKDREEKEREQELQRNVGQEEDGTRNILNDQGQDRQSKERELTKEQQEERAADDIKKLLYGDKDKKKDDKEREEDDRDR